MSLIVEKFGGSSLKDTECLIRAATAAKREAEAGNKLVVVVSARGDTTDHLLTEARELCKESGIPDRELDALLATGEQASAALFAMALHRISVPAVSFTGAQAGIHTDSCPAHASILSIDPVPIEKQLNRGNAVIVAGFQGIDDEGNITTLGRGGSDTSAAAIAAALSADRCMIFTDVDGVYTADPGTVPSAFRYKRLSYREMLEFARLGAKVLSSGSVAVAQKNNLPLTVLSSARSDGGTLITGETFPHFGAVTGITKTASDGKMLVSAVCPDLMQNMEAVSSAAALLATHGIRSECITVRRDSFSILMEKQHADHAVSLLHSAYFEN